MLTQLEPLMHSGLAARICGALLDEARKVHALQRQAHDLLEVCDEDAASKTVVWKLLTEGSSPADLARAARWLVGVHPPHQHEKYLACIEEFESIWVPPPLSDHREDIQDGDIHSVRVAEADLANAGGALHAPEETTNWVTYFKEYVAASALFELPPPPPHIVAVPPETRSRRSQRASAPTHPNRWMRYYFQMWRACTTRTTSITQKIDRTRQPDLRTVVQHWRDVRTLRMKAEELHRSLSIITSQAHALLADPRAAKRELWRDLYWANKLSSLSTAIASCQAAVRDGLVHSDLQVALDHATNRHMNGKELPGQISKDISASLSDDTQPKEREEACVRLLMTARTAYYLGLDGVVKDEEKRACEALARWLRESQTATISPIFPDDVQGALVKIRERQSRERQSREWFFSLSPNRRAIDDAKELLEAACPPPAT